ncbi:MAG TPA: histidine phosphatase family protein [Aquificales bacterium]|uniref:Histidine phosphatase family protein n=1 Tax=Aquifex aeolicus TaxID=63363 RepID=A0A9D0YPJ2_AQUAO|nr:histidine phosphatase family protein [Aquificales bacterium]HIP98296.1 histidine phosphatase family protein [Aquifex aeolicus]
MQIYLLRHAQSEGNKRGLFQGSLDFPLSKEGKLQAQRAGEFLKRFKFDLVVSSPQKRAMQTAQIVAAILGLKVKVDGRLKEISYGILEGKSHREVEDWNEYQKWLENPVKNPLQGVDPMDKLQERVESFLNDVPQWGKKVLVVTHGGIVRAIICTVGNLGMENLWRFSVSNVSLSLVELKRLNPPRGKIKFVNLPTAEI